jgi:superfamily II DNA or RNA helicase
MDVNPTFSLDQYILHVNKVEIKKLKGDLFERSSIDYFREHCPGYRYILYKDYSKPQKDYFGLPYVDHGVDIIGLKEDSNEILLIQCKYKGNKNETVSYSKDKISNLIGMVKIVRDIRPNWKIFHYVITTGKKVTDLDPSLRAVVGREICGKIRLNLNYLQQSIGNKTKKERVLRDYQIKIIEKLVQHFITNDKKEGRIVMATGTGKTFTCLEYIRQNLLVLREPKILIVTNLRNLADQTCSTFVDELGDNVLLISQDGTTDSNRIKKSREKIHISTYNSMEIPLSVCKYDMVVFDESHHSGSDNRKNIIDKIDSKILYMTATEREATQAELIAKYSIGDGIRDGFLSDYRINIFGCYIDPSKDIIEQRYKSIISGLITKINDEEITKIVVYCQDQSSAKIFYRLLKEEIVKIEIDVYHHLLISDNSSYNRDKRIKHQKKFTESDVGIIVNVNIMIEGIDIPEIDSIVFADNRTSKITVLQSIGRALRISPGKKYSTICLATDIMNDLEDNKSSLELLKKQQKKIHNILNYLISEDDTYLDFPDDYVQNYKIKYQPINNTKTRTVRQNVRIKIDLPRKNGTKKEIYIQTPKIEEFSRNLEKINLSDLVKNWNNAEDKTKFLIDLQKKDKKWSSYLKIWVWVSQNKTYPYYFLPEPPADFREQESYDQSCIKAKKYTEKLSNIIGESTEFSKIFIISLSNLVVHQSPGAWRKVLSSEDRSGLRMTCRYQQFLLSLLKNSEWISGIDVNPKPVIKNLIEILPNVLFYLGDLPTCLEKYIKEVNIFLEKTFEKMDRKVLEEIKNIEYKTFHNHGLLQLLKILENQPNLTKIWTVYHFVPKLPERVKKTFVDKVYSLGCWILSTQPWK